MRVYIPASLPLLASWVEAGRVPASNEYFVADDESEDAEYVAMVAAAIDAADLLDGPGRRVVVVGPAVGAGGDEDPHIAAIPVEEILAVHVDDEDVDPEAEELPDLGWYAPQEIPALLAR
ncbi:MAG TPA: hypothetical protein VF426_06045 [Marmoricola sp.]